MVYIFSRVILATFLIFGPLAVLADSSAFAQNVEEMMRKQRLEQQKRDAENKKYQDQILKQWQQNNGITPRNDPNYQRNQYDDVIDQLENDARRREQQRIAEERAADARFQADMARRRAASEKRQRELARPSNPYVGGSSNSSQKPAGFGDGYAGGYKTTKPSGLGVNQSRASGASSDWGDDIDDFSARDEKLKDAPAKQSTPIGCMCKGSDKLRYGIECMERYGKVYIAALKPPYYPYTSACRIGATIRAPQK